MSLIEHTFFPRSAFDMDWMRPEPLLGLGTLDIFDPFDELDRSLGRNIMWLDVPEALRAAVTTPQPRVPRKYRIQVRCEGFSPSSIKTKLSEDKKQLVVHAKEGAGPAGDKSNYTLREFRRTYNLPDNVDTDQLMSFMTSNKRLIIEMPIREKEQEKQQQKEQLQEDLLPRITDTEGGQKQVQMNMVLPSNIDPAKIKVTCKDRDVIVQAESKQDTSDQQSQLFYYRRTTLPENANLTELKCTFDNNRLSIKAPLDLSLDQSPRTIPVEFAQKQQPLQQQQKPEQVEISGDEARGTEQTTCEKEKCQQQGVEAGGKVEGKQASDLSSKVKAWSIGDKQQEVGQ
jgi:HSP20 family molecular chaperone IbpA